MQRHGKSLFADNKQALAAVHYQNREVDRDTVCYSCHKDYALFGDVTAKMNGLRHVWAHYVAGVQCSAATSWTARPRPTNTAARRILLVMSMRLPQGVRVDLCHVVRDPVTRQARRRA